MNEEKEHLAELTCLLIKQDPTQKDRLRKSLKLKLDDDYIAGLDCLVEK